MESEQLLIDTLKGHNQWFLWNNNKYTVRLKSGLISNFYANCSVIHTLPDIQSTFAGDLVNKLAQKTASIASFLSGQTNVWVIGSAYGAIGLAQDIASALWRRVDGWLINEPTLRAAFTEKVVETKTLLEQYPDMRTTAFEGCKTITGASMQLKRFDLGEKPYVILCEDVLTTGGTTRQTIQAIIEKHPDARFAPVVLVYVNRSGDVLFDTRWPEMFPETSSGELSKRSPDLEIVRNFEVISIVEVDAKTWKENNSDAWPKEMIQGLCPECHGEGRTRIKCEGPDAVPHPGQLCRKCNGKRYILPTPIRPKGQWDKLQEKCDGG